jgi:hypothetical protein
MARLSSQHPKQPLEDGGPNLTDKDDPERNTGATAQKRPRFREAFFYLHYGYLLYWTECVVAGLIAIFVATFLVLSGAQPESWDHGYV